jgi:hypothetical protein
LSALPVLPVPGVVPGVWVGVRFSSFLPFAKLSLVSLVPLDGAVFVRGSRELFADPVLPLQAALALAAALEAKPPVWSPELLSLLVGRNVDGVSAVVVGTLAALEVSLSLLLLPSK